MNETPKPTSEVLNLAADLIEKRGWTAGGGGWPGCHPYLEPESSPLCLEGAIMAALGWVAHDDDSEQTPLSDVDTCPAGQAVREYLNYGGTYLFEWNDSGRTQAEVIAVLRAAAVIAEARESELAQVVA